MRLLAGQFNSLVIWVLIGAALISVALGEVIDGLAILAIVGLNAVIGFFQEYRAEQSVSALARLAAPKARVPSASVFLNAGPAERGPCANRLGKSGTPRGPHAWQGMSRKRPWASGQTRAPARPCSRRAKWCGVPWPRQRHSSPGCYPTLRRA